MQILLLGLFIAIFLHDAAVVAERVSADGSVRAVEALPADSWPYLGPLPVLAIVVVPKLLLVLIYHTACMRSRRRLGSPGGERTLKRLEKLTTALPFVLLGLFVADLVFGALRAARIVFQHVVLIDELLVMLPTIAAVIASWWSYYPVDRRLRESIVFRQADRGLPVFPLLSRWGYVSMQARHQLGLLLLPLLAVLAWAEAVLLLGPGHRGLISERTATLLTPAGILAVFVLSPLVIRYAWHTTPLAPGELRDRMLGLCNAHRVRVRELLLWQTGGGMVNAAVTGLLARVRYILLSDGLLEQVAPREVEAVMAHEIAHVKQRHMIWMIATLLAMLGTLELIANKAMGSAVALYASKTIDPVGTMGPAWFDLYDPQNQTLLIAGPVFAAALLLFGWVSRRFERQADVFAARHLAQTSQTPEHDELGRQVFDRASIDTMVHALRRVAVLNHTSIKRPSWRHGSIHWRQQHLRTLVGQPITDTPVDRVLWRVKALVLLALAGWIAASIAGGRGLASVLGW